MNNQELEKRNKTLERRWKIVLILAILFVLSRPVALKIVNNLIHQAAVNAECTPSYKYISTLAICEPPTIKKTGYAETQDRINNYINQEKAAKHVTDVSLYFRDLKQGPAWGINELDDFAPASLLKLPLALVYLTKADSDPQFLQKKLVFKPGPDFQTVDQTYKPKETIKPDVSYTIEELLERMLKYSDNNASALLETYLKQTGQEEMYRKTFLELGIIASNDAYDEIVGVRRYASIYRALYNSSFVNPDLSEKVLSWLINSDFEAGLRAGVPDDVSVASKFGERVLLDDTKQLHDCGIVYYPSNPYLLCIMTRGYDFDDMSQIMGQISKDIYKEVDSRKLN